MEKNWGDTPSATLKINLSVIHSEARVIFLL